ncbi:MAG: hypothetical protein AAGM21_06745 [Pseudomonadota bacterium]
MIAPLTLAALVFAAPASAGVFALTDCADHALGTEFCSPEAALDMLGGIEPAWGNRFDRDAPYAIVTVLSMLRDGLSDRIETGACETGEVMAFAADELWAVYIGDMAEGMPISYEMEFSVLRRYTGNVIAYLTNGECEVS